MTEETPPTTGGTPPPAAKRWHYWVAFNFMDGGAGACEIVADWMVATAEQVEQMQENIRRNSGRAVIVLTWTLLRVEPAEPAPATAPTTSQVGDWVRVTTCCCSGNPNHESRHGRITSIPGAGAANILLGTDIKGREIEVCAAAGWEPSTLADVVRADRARADAGWTGPK
jgi:hypothetical protein